MIKYYKIRPSLYFIESLKKSYNQLYNFTQNSHNAQYTTVWKGFKVDKISINWLHLINECRVWSLIYNSILYSLILCLISNIQQYPIFFNSMSDFWFTDKGSNDTGSNDKGSNDSGSNEKGSKARQRVKRHRVKKCDNGANFF